MLDENRRCPTVSDLPSPPQGSRGWPWTEESHRLSDTMLDGSAWPRVSIVTPSYNQGHFIEKTIRSVLLQGYPNLEYWVMDGGSTDETVEIIRKYEPWLGGWVSEPDRGQGHAINKGFHRATGQILGWLNSDDTYEAGALGTVAEQFSSSKSVAAVVGGGIVVTPQGIVRRRSPRDLSPRRLMLWGPTPCQPAVFFSHGVFQEIGGIDEALHQYLDREFWIRIGLQYPPSQIILIDDVLARRLSWAGCKTHQNFHTRILTKERVYILEKIFAKSDLADHLRPVRSMAYSEFYLREALWQAVNGGNVASACQELARAVLWDPPYFLERCVKALCRRLERGEV